MSRYALPAFFIRSTRNGIGSPNESKPGERTTLHRPKTEDGKAVVSQNNFQHGLSGRFQVLPWEPQCEFDSLFAALRLQHKPETCFEISLIEKMVQHYWLP